MLTPIFNLIPPAIQDREFKQQEPVKLIDKIYWRFGATYKDNNRTESKLLTNFKRKYDADFIKLVGEFSNRSVYDRYSKLLPEIKPKVEKMLVELENIILIWKIAHMNMIYEHIPSGAAATGGTDYVKYLPQISDDKSGFNEHQQVIYFPELWDESRRSNFNEYISKQIKELPNQLLGEIKELFPTELKELEPFPVSSKNNVIN